jgi:hypothetical protein
VISSGNTAMDAEIIFEKSLKAGLHEKKFWRPTFASVMQPIRD